MAKNVKILKVEVEKSEYKTSKVITIKNMKNQVIVELNVFADGAIFIRQADEIFIQSDYVASVKLNEEDKNCPTYHKIVMAEEHNTNVKNFKENFENGE
jgi:hypothetical protein